MDFLKDSDLLKIEDVLPFFPDFVLIDEFKEAVVVSLREYNSHLDTLQSAVRANIPPSLSSSSSSLSSRSSLSFLSSAASSSLSSTSA